MATSRSLAAYLTARSSVGTRKSRRAGTESVVAAKAAKRDWRCSPAAFSDAARGSFSALAMREAAIWPPRAMDMSGETAKGKQQQQEDRSHFEAGKVRGVRAEIPGIQMEFECERFEEGDDGKYSGAEQSEEESQAVQDGEPEDQDGKDVKLAIDGYGPGGSLDDGEKKKRQNCGNTKEQQRTGRHRQL
jgi:hypothetical protein